MADEKEVQLTTEKVAYWYFRLNGFLQIENFIVHPESGGGGQRTDADLIGVRFPHRAERFIDDPAHVMQDDVERLELSENLTEIVIVEVKTNDPCTLNGPWTDEDAANVQRVLAAIGCFEPCRLAEVATGIYSQGIFEDDKLKLRVRLVTIGASENETLRQDMSGVVQITWPEVLGFIGHRLYEYRSAKNDSPQWDDQILLMKKFVLANRADHRFQQQSFIADCLKCLGVKSQ